MAGPTSEVLNEDLKALRDDLHRIDISLRGESSRVEMSLMSQISDVKADVRELSTQVKGILTAIKLLAVLSITSLAASIWWGATLTSDVRHLTTEFAEFRKSMGEKTTPEGFRRGQDSPASTLPPGEPKRP